MTDKIDEIIQLLRSEITSMEADASSASKERMEHLLLALEGKLANPEDETQHNSLINSLKDSVTHFEVSHPTLTGVLNELMMTLSNMGI